MKLTYPGTAYTSDRTVDVWWYDGGETPPAELLQKVDGSVPPQGSIVVGTEGLLILPHVSPDPFVTPIEKMGSLPQLDLPDRDHYAEFIDAVLAHSTTCSAGFDYAGPLTESVLIGNVAARFPNETLEFDGKSLSFPKKREANEFLRRTYRKGYGV